ncbi:UNVERIFIED_CONTAM: hypothetical protein Slati_3104000 [Sesamum latifolium]|uniref:Reverse transcriptase domain-containing protein n=1 Tax=Sesamum latifolium TaxID=2727402 RepID=A0AAW2UXI4_9LAMI
MLIEEVAVSGEFVEFFTNLLGGHRRNRFLHLEYLRPWACYVFTADDGDFLIRPVLREEVKEAVFEIDEDKAPGPDGFSSGFYKAAWPVIGDEVAACNCVSDFRPISCCNVLYKIISRIMVQRMQGFMTKLVDLRKAYDTLEWNFVVLRLFGFPVRFIDWIEKCISSTSFSVSLNGGLHARVQLLQSVISALNIYWATAFVLPKSVIRAIEARMRNFLWRGGADSGMAKMAWKDVCKPCEEGGQGIRALQPLNQTLMCKHLWEVVQHNDSSIWVSRILHYRLSHTTIWTAGIDFGSWSWRKILRLRHQLLDHVYCSIETGDNFLLWQDSWHPLGPLIYRFPRGPSILRIPLDAKLSTGIRDGQWNWPKITDIEHVEILHRLPLLGDDDRIGWDSPTGCLTNLTAYRLFQPQGPKVPVSGIFAFVLCYDDYPHWTELGGMDRIEHVFCVLMERNQRRFAATHSAPVHTARLTMEQIRMRLIGEDLSYNCKAQVQKLKGFAEGFDQDRLDPYFDGNLEPYPEDDTSLAIDDEFSCLIEEIEQMG